MTVSPHDLLPSSTELSAFRQVGIQFFGVDTLWVVIKFGMSGQDQTHLRRFGGTLFGVVPKNTQVRSDVFFTCPSKWDLNRRQCHW